MSNVQAPRPGVERATDRNPLIDWLSAMKGDMAGIRFAVNVFIASTIVWYTLEKVVDTNPIWAIASMIAASDAEVREAARMFKCRITNVLVGCGVGLLFLIIGGSSEWKLPFALAATVLLSSYVIRIPSMWRQAPITAAIVIAAGLSHHSKLSGVEHGLHKVAEVTYGCLVGLLVTWLMSKLWPLAASEQEPKPH
jgi:uncharacterized membrane protein YccC